MCHLDPIGLSYAGFWGPSCSRPPSEALWGTHASVEGVILQLHLGKSTHTNMVVTFFSGEKASQRVILWIAFMLSWGQKPSQGTPKCTSFYHLSYVLNERKAVAVLFSPCHSAHLLCRHYPSRPRLLPLNRRSFLRRSRAQRPAHDGLTGVPPTL